MTDEKLIQKILDLGARSAYSYLFEGEEKTQFLHNISEELKPLRVEAANRFNLFLPSDDSVAAPPDKEDYRDWYRRMSQAHATVI